MYVSHDLRLRCLAAASRSKSMYHHGVGAVGKGPSRESVGQTIPIPMTKPRGST